MRMIERAQAELDHLFLAGRGIRTPGCFPCGGAASGQHVQVDRRRSDIVWAGVCGYVGAALSASGLA
jgi:hypothetical protein